MMPSFRSTSTITSVMALMLAASKSIPLVPSPWLPEGSASALAVGVLDAPELPVWCDGGGGRSGTTGIGVPGLRKTLRRFVRCCRFWGEMNRGIAIGALAGNSEDSWEVGAARGACVKGVPAALGDSSLVWGFGVAERDRLLGALAFLVDYEAISCIIIQIRKSYLLFPSAASMQ